MNKVSTKICPKCSGEMVPGKLQDLAEHTFASMTKKYRAIRWVPGEGTAWGIYTLKKDVGVTTYLCTKCGYIENYGELK